jgi:phage-related protein
LVEFVDGLASVKHRAAILADIDLLATEGPVLPFPLTSAIATHRGLRELRTRFGGAQFRIIYTLLDGDVVVLHAFQKTSTAQLQHEYEVAAERARSIR